MRIAMLGHKRIPSREGGVEVVVEELAVRMAAAGHEVTCYNRKGHHVSGSKFDTAQIDEYKGVKLKTVPTLDKKGLAAMTASFFAAVFAAFGRYDVVHFHAEGPCAMLWLPKLMGKRCVATIHGLDHQRSKWGKLAKAYIMLGEMCAAKFADEIIVLSKSDQEYIAQRYGREARMIPNGIDRPEIRPSYEIEKKYRLKKDGYLLFLGRIVPEKGIHDLIDAFDCVHTDKRLVIAGGASDSEVYLQKIKEMVRKDERILLTGFVQGRLLEELYSNAYFYVLPSSLEGMPLSLMEAMSYGNCCLTSDISGCIEVMGDCGVTFEKGNTDDLQKKLKMLLDSPQMVEKYRSESAECVLRRFSWDDVVERTLEVYEKDTEATE